ncbi:Bug family tripartite tricarboxylate transporter substrate binding protein [Enterovirga sp. CN4-39]|uniref:Bug family tripartite tricarboxylate transporter substrate binding protein n=1 Tax=Enterovirga sp. CN4-39 TaxID=3400910 RepID=UPI003C09D506
MGDDRFLGGTARLNRRTALALMAGALAAPSIARADKYPIRPVRFIAHWSAGGATDTLARIYCQKVGEIAGQQFIVENRLGGGGLIGADGIAKAEPDGYTVGLGSITTNSVPRLLYSKMAFDPAKDFTFIGGLWKLPNIAVVPKSLGVKTMPELIALLKKNPNKYFFGSSGAGTTTHLAGEMFKQLAGVEIDHVPFRGGAPAVTAMLGGQIHLYFDNIPGALPLVQSGELIGLGITAETRDPNLPDLPALNEFVPGFDITSWCCLCGPPKLPASVVEPLTTWTNQALDDPALKKRYAELGATAWKPTQEELIAFRDAEEKKFTPIIEKMGIKLN